MDDARDPHRLTPVEHASGEPIDGEREPAPDPEVRAAELEELKRQLSEKQDRLLRALAEVDNVKRRTQRERDEYVRYANESLIRELLPVIDNFDRALEAARATGEATKVVEGVTLIQRELLKVLERVGVTRYPALGERFDPNRHEATGRVASGSHPPDTVVAEMAPGYLLNGRVLRPAQVVVAAVDDANVG